MFSFRFWSLSALYTAGSALLLGVPTLLIPNHLFSRIVPTSLQDYVIWIENPSHADLPAIYNGAMIFVLPSHYEGFGLTALEAMACGTPTIVAQRSSLPEVVGDTGILVDPDEPEAIADAIRRLLFDSDLHTALRNAGIERAATFTWRNTAERALDVYQRVHAG